MLKHVAILAIPVLTAVAAAQGMTAFAAAKPAREPAMVVPISAPASAAPGARPAEVAKAADGHYWAQADVDGRAVRFLVDTGASAVALTPTDAQRLGLDLTTLEFNRPVVTANGVTQAAPVVLHHLTIAGARVDDVDALVVKTGLTQSLLGMSYLGRLSQFEATRTALILRP